MQEVLNPIGTYIGAVETMVAYKFGFILKKSIARVGGEPMEVNINRDLMFHRNQCPDFACITPEMTVYFELAPRDFRRKEWEAVNVRPANVT